MNALEFTAENFWFLTREGRNQNGGIRYSIRRKLIRKDGTFYYERRPYRDFQTLRSLRELNDYIIRLNGRAYEEQLAKKEIFTQHAWINQSTREKFKEKIEARIPNSKDAKYLYNLCISKFLKFFLDHLKVQDPTLWKEHEYIWGKALMNDPVKESHRLWDKNFKPSVKTLRSIIQVSNQFLEFLCEKYPKEYQNLKLNPITRVQFKHYEATKIHDESEVGRTKYICDEHWAIIKKKLPTEIKAFVVLAYYYGLRRNEAMAIQLKDIRQEYLSVERQFLSVVNGKVKTRPLKSRENRKTPHWFMSAEDCYEVVELLKRTNFMHPDTFTQKWTNFMNQLGYEYQLHDLRRTFITNCFRIPRGKGIRGVDVMPTDIQLAVGHQSIATTMLYKQDDRKLDDRVFVPRGR